MGRIINRNVTLEMGLRSLEAKRRLEQHEIQMPTRPRVAVPELPDDLTEQSDAALMRLFTRTTKWSEYLSAQVAAAEVDERYADAVVEKIKALTSLEYKGEKTVSAAKARAYTDEDYLDAIEEQQRAYAFRKLISAVFENSERTAALLSRELTRRVNRDTRERRVERWQP
jgi:hypothetical protein